MRLRIWAGLIAGAAMGLGLGTAMYGAEGPEDPFLWLEDVHGAKPLDWVKERNAVSLKLLKSDPDYQGDYDVILAILDAVDRIPMGQLHGGTVFNFWQDPAHVRGIWRRTDVASYETATPRWETLLDVDRLAADEGKGWVFKGANCAPDLSRCLISLSPDGGDTVVLLHMMGNHGPAYFRRYPPELKRFTTPCRLERGTQSVRGVVPAVSR